MTKEEAIKILQNIVKHNEDEDAAIFMAIRALRDASSLPTNLDEAAEEALDDVDANWQIDERNDGCTEPAYNKKQMLTMFKAGAEWMAGQGYTKEETVYFERLCDENRIMVDLGWGEPERGGFNPGDRVVVQIRKKQ